MPATAGYSADPDTVAALKRRGAAIGRFLALTLDSESMSQYYATKQLPICVCKDMEAVFRALADESRRLVLDALFENDGQTLKSLSAKVAMTRQGLSKHLQILEEAGLVLTEFHGREKRHFLNPMPIHMISERWLAKYAAHQMRAVSALKAALDGEENE